MTIPYLPDDREILYVPKDNEYMVKARDYAIMYSLDRSHPTGAVVVKDDEIIGYGSNGSEYHQKHGCIRKEKNIPTGTQYELCEGCHPRHHAEPRAIKDAFERMLSFGRDPEKEIPGSDLYLWGHWWCCKDCWNAMIEAKMRNVYLMEAAEKEFNKEVTNQDP